MADDKKAGGSPMTDSKAVGQIVTMLAVLLILGMLFTALLNFIEGFQLGATDTVLGRIADYFSRYIWPIWKIIAGLLSVLAFAGVIYSLWQLNIIDVEEKPIYDPEPDDVSSAVASGAVNVSNNKNEKWERVLEHANSTNPSDWRLAIIEADVMLEEVLRNAGFPGDSIGDMLKSVNKGDFVTIEEAWEAHKVRNRIAHDGGNFQLTDRETRRVVSLFEKVFQEFGVI